ncbi:MAG: NUDIX hydrolase [Rubrivivax sp.]|nr:NUDIX hydrolase [Rubrivivax sp.]
MATGDSADPPFTPLEGDDHLRERLIEPHTVLEGSFLTVRRDLVALPDGTRATREYIAHPGAVAVVPLLDDERVVLVRQHRYPVNRVLLELPAGKRDAGESTLACAMRELAEETGYQAAEWAFGGEIVNAAAYSTESLWIWFARGLVAGTPKLDAGEFVETVVCTVAELLELDRAGQLPDVKTVIGLHWLAAWKAGQREMSFTAAHEHEEATPPIIGSR